MRRLECKRFSWPVVQSLHDESYLLPADIPKVHPFREVLPDQAIYILVQSAFPRVVRLGEITLGIEAFIDQFVRRKLPTVVVSDRLHPLLMGGQEPHNLRCYVGGILPFYLAYKLVFARTFDQRHKESPRREGESLDFMFFPLCLCAFMPSLLLCALDFGLPFTPPAPKPGYAHGKSPGGRNPCSTPS